MMRSGTSTTSLVALESTNGTTLKIFSVARTSTQSFATSVDWEASSSRSFEDSAALARFNASGGSSHPRAGGESAIILGFGSVLQPTGLGERQQLADLL